MKRKAAVVGLGNIGLGYDFSDRTGELTLTHSTAFSQHQKTELVAGVDPDQSARLRFTEKFHAPAYSSVKELFSHHHPELVAVGVPTHLHASVVTELLGHGVKGILCEKPLASTLEEAEDLGRLVTSAQCSFLVNFPRRFDPAVLELKRIIDSGQIGRPFKGSGWYSSGILNGGSHFIDLLCFLLGDCSGVRVLGGGSRANLKDPEPDVQLTFGDVQIFLLSGREDYYSTGELEVKCTEGTFRYPLEDRKIFWKKAGPDPTFPDYRILGAQNEIEASVNRYMLPVLDALVRSVESGSMPASNFSTAMQTMKIIEEIKQQAKGAKHV